MILTIHLTDKQAKAAARLLEVEAMQDETYRAEDWRAAAKKIRAAIAKAENKDDAQ